MTVSQIAAAVVVSDKGNVLVVSAHGLSWSLPKGHIDEGETALQAAIRETEEESGVTDLTLVKQLASYERHKTSLTGGDELSELKQITPFLFVTQEVEPHPTDPENPEARWVNPAEVSALLTHRKDKSFFESVLPEVEKLVTK